MKNGKNPIIIKFKSIVKQGSSFYLRIIETKFLLKRINFKFVYLLLFFNDLLFHIHGVNLYLQDVKSKYKYN